MNKTAIIIFTLLNYFQIYSQDNFLIEYEAVYNTDRPTKENGFLYINNANNKSFYTTSKIDSSKIKKNEVIDTEIKIVVTSGIEEFNLYDYNKNKLLTREDIFRDSYLISEDVPNFNWTLLDETKISDSITLNKATCYFRGREYTAWYSLENPIKSGPWKFNGLPGLIYEVYDQTNRYNWYLKKITKNNFDINKLDLNDSKENVITIQKFAELKFSNNNLNNQLLSKLPRGTEIISQTIKRTGLETKFEWEK